MNVLVGVTQHRDSHMTRFLKALGLARGTTVNVMHVIEFPPFMNQYTSVADDWKRQASANAHKLTRSYNPLLGGRWPTGSYLTRRRNTAGHRSYGGEQEAWDARAKTLTEHLGGGGLDGGLLALPLRRVMSAAHPKMIATTQALRDRLSAGQGLLYRYLHEDSPDGISGGEGAFLLCSFWLVDNLAKQGQLQEAFDLYDSLCGRAGTLGLLPEEIEPSTGAFLGNYPQAFSHIGMISSGVNLARTLQTSRLKNDYT
jgi:GH15 family glucan-1,4-alpha-glucosidase